MSALALLAWSAPALGGIAAAVLGPRGARAAVAGPAVTAAVGAVVLAGAPAPGIDVVGALMLLLVGGVTATVQCYANRQLAAAQGGRATTALLGLAATATAVFVTAESLLPAAGGWTAASAAFLAVLAVHRRLPSGQDALRRAAAAFVLADLALWAAVILVATGGQAGSAAGHAAAILLVLAAAARAAQVPLHGWLVTTTAAPTPVCAFLHAGIVNAGGILLLREQELLTASVPAMALAVAIGATTMVLAAIAMAVRSDVKGMLACSTSAQMGFMLMTCGLGAWAATVIHIAGHAMYKAAGFLGAGGAIAEHIRRRTVPARPAGRRRPAADAALAAAVPLLGLGAAGALAGVGEEKAVLLVFAWVTGAAALWSALRRLERPGDVAAAAAAGGGLAVVYLLGAVGLTDLLGLPPDDLHPPAALALLPLAGAGAALLAWRSGGALRDRLYMRAMRLSRPGPAPHWMFRADPGAAPHPAAARTPSTAIAQGGAA